MAIKISELSAGHRVQADDLFETVQDTDSTNVSNQISAEELIPGPDLPPTPTGAQDDEFDGDLSAWTETNKNGYQTAISKSMAHIFHATGESSGFLLHRALPVGNYTLTAKISITAGDAASKNIGIALHQSGTTKLKTLTWNNGVSAIIKSYWSTFSTISGGASISLRQFGQWIYLRMIDNGTNIIYQVSNNGAQFITIGSESRTTDFTADHFGLYVFANTGPNCLSCDWMRIE